MKNYQLIIISLVAVTFLSCSTEVKNESLPAETTKIVAGTEDAVVVASQWLELIDAKEYDKSWVNSASIFQEAISQEKWGITLNGLLPAYGKVKSREMISATPYEELPGAPKGEYVVIQYKSSFEFKDGIETITPMKQNGIWKVSGYFIN